jgi:periplasmic protein TonB
VMPAQAPASREPATAAAMAMDPAPEAGNPTPAYPERARRQGIEGTVLIKISVDGDGAPTGAIIATSSGHDLLDEEALRTVWRWRFRPAVLNGRAVPGLVVVPIIFELHV